MSSDCKKISDNSVNYITWNFNPGVALYKNTYSFLLLYTKPYLTSEEGLCLNTKI